MRILHVTDHYQPVLGGIEAHVTALADRQAAHGHEVTVLTSTPARADGELCDDRGPVQVLRTRSRSVGLRVDRAAFDVLHAHVSVVAPFTAPVAALAARRGLPTVVTVHSMWNGRGPVPAAAATLTGLRGAPVLWTSVSRTAATELARRLPDGTDVHVLNNAVDVAPRTTTPHRSDSPDGAVRLVSTMRVAHRKRPLPLVRVFADLRRTAGVPTTLTIVGDGPLRRRVEAAADRFGVGDCVTVTGRLPSAGVIDVLARSDVYVAPAVLESFGLAALEARCVGLPVVGHGATGLPEFIGHDREGLLGRDDDDVRAHLEQLVEDHGLRFRMSEHNRTVASSMTWQTALAQHETAYSMARVRARRPCDERLPAFERG